MQQDYKKFDDAFLSNPHQVMKKTREGLIIGADLALDGKTQQAIMAKRDAEMKGTTLSDQEKALGIETEKELVIDKAYEKAVNAPIPNIGFIDTSILLRAVPLKTIKSSSGLILEDLSNLNGDIPVKSLGYKVDPIQEVIVIGDLVAEHYPTLHVGMVCRIDERKFMAARNGQGEDRFDTEVWYDIPVITIDNHQYIKIQAHELAYYKKEE